MSAPALSEPPQAVHYASPDSLSKAVDILAGDPDATPLAGGTDLAVAIRHGVIHPGLIVDLKNITEMAPAIRHSDGSHSIAANTPMTDIERDHVIRERLPGLVEAAEVVGSVQIRNRATLAGNLSNASPAADTPPVLMALEASVVIVGPAGERRLRIDDLLTGYRETALERGELLVAIEIPDPGPGAGSAFLKLGVRRAMEISIVCVGARVQLADDGAISSSGIGLGSVAPRTVRPTGSEELLRGCQPTSELLAEAGRAALGVCNPIDDLRASAEYRRAMVPVMVERALTIALERARATR